VPEADKPLTRRLDESGAAALPNVDLPSKKNAAHIEMLVLHPTRPAIRLRAARNLAAKLRHAALLLGRLGAIVLHDWRSIPFSASSLMKSASRATKASSIFRLNGGCANCSRLRTNTLH